MGNKNPLWQHEDIYIAAGISGKKMRLDRNRTYAIAAPEATALSTGATDASLS